MNQATETTQTMQTTPIIPTKSNKAALIRALLKQKHKPKDIAEDVGCAVQYVYSVQNYERVKARKARAKKREDKIQQQTKRKYTKSGKYTKRAAPVTAPAPEQPKIQYVEVPVPQPHYNLTWKQRFVALFTGRV